MIVINPSGLANTLVGGYTYLSPLVFSFNGNWEGWDTEGVHVGVRFTIKDNLLVSIACDDTILTFASPPAVTNGEFAFARSDGVSVTGRIVGTTSAVGTINLPPCEHVGWAARARSPDGADRLAPSVSRDGFVYRPSEITTTS